MLQKMLQYFLFVNYICLSCSNELFLGCKEFGVQSTVGDSQRDRMMSQNISSWEAPEYVYMLTETFFKFC